MDEEGQLKEAETNQEPPVKNKKTVKVLDIVIFFLVAVMIVSCYFLVREMQEPKQASAPEETQNTTQTEPTAEETLSTIQTEPNVEETTPEKRGSELIELPTYAEEFLLVEQKVMSFLETEYEDSILYAYVSPRQDGSRLDASVPVKLFYNIYEPEGRSVTAVRVAVSEDENFYIAREYEADKDGVTLERLKTGTQYYYRVYATMSNHEVHMAQGSFRTAESPRLLSIDGIVNVRDIGGWKTTDGKTVKQGLLYRGSELDGIVEPEFFVTDEGVKEMLTQLGIRMDMDLRSEGERVLGDGVKYASYGVYQYEGAFTDEGKDAIRRVFADLANPENYPAYLHCTYGADRTGTVCYLLEALVGVSDEDLVKEYALSSLYYTYTSPQLMEPFMEKLASYPGETTQEKAESFLLEVGVTADEIARIRQIFLAD